MLKNNFFYFAAVIGFAVVLSGCGHEKQQITDHRTQESSASVADNSTVQQSLELESKENGSTENNVLEQSTSTETTPAMPSEQLALYRACQLALQKLDQQSLLPDETSVKEKPDCFTIQDIDGDGFEDLVLAWQTSSSFGNRFSVYGYDHASNTFHVKWNDTASIKLYDLGTVLKPVPVNYGLSSTDTFYPYGFYQYQDEKHCYQFQGYVDAWQKSYLSVDYAGNSYPGKIDIENVGMVYCITYCSEGADYVNDYSYSQNQYDLFCQENFGTQVLIENMTAFTPDQIQKLL